MARPHKARLLADYDDTPNPLNRSLAKAVAIVYFLVVSSVATFSIKSMLVVYKLDLPLLLSLCQAGVTIAATLPFKPTWSASVYGLFPLAFAYVMNLVSGLVGTERLTVPMYIALRRIGILFVICLERAIYGQTHSAACVASVLLMCFGSLVAAFNDLSFDAIGYMSVTVHNLFSAANIVLVKHNQAATEMRMPHLLFFNAFLGTPLLATAFVRSSEMSKLDQFAAASTAPMFYVSFATSCIIGVLVTHASFNLTRTTSALTCSVTGSIKSIALSLLGALAFSDFKYNLYNVVGLAVSMAGAGWYAAVAGKSA